MNVFWVLVFVTVKLGLAEDCYGAMFDAGSSGTRVYVYKWDCRDIKEVPLVDITEEAPDKKVKPGLASFAEDIAGVEAYLKPLLDFARESIPAEMIEYTPVMLGATAGMRIIPTQAQNSILAEVRRVFRESAFDFLDDNWARVISGQEEGAYMWLSVNYMLGTLLVDDVTRSSHVVDLGGASTQLGVVDGNSFTQNFLNVELPLSDGTTMERDIYAISYLYYGNDQARAAAIAMSNSLLGKESNRFLHFPCYNKGYVEHWNDQVILGTGDVHHCTKVIQHLLNYRKCTKSFCGMKGYYQPQITASQKLYAVNGVLYAARFFDLEEYQVGELLQKSKDLCALDYETLLKVYGDEDPYLITQCFLSLYSSLLLQLGYKVPADLKIVSPSKINGISPSWTLAGVFYQMENKSISDQ